MDRVLLVQLLAVIVSTVECRENGLYDFYRQCVSQSKAVIGCPSDHLIAVSHATYYKSKEAGCNTMDADRCKVSEDHKDTFEKCYQLTNCEITLSEPASVPPACDEYQGDTYLELRYKCEARLTGPKGQSAPMCSNLNFKGSLVFLINEGFPKPSSESGCSCDIQIADQTYIQYTILLFEDTLQPHINVNYCPQKLHFWTDYQNGTEHTVCSHAKDEIKPLNISTKGHAVITLEASRIFMMILIVQVYHEQEMTIRCTNESVPFTVTESSVSSEMPITTEEPSTPSLSNHPEVTTESQVGNDPDGLTEEDTVTPIVVSVVVILVVIIILLLIGILYLRHTRAKERKEARKEQTERFAFENVTYDTARGNIPNGTGQMSNGPTTMVVGNGIVSSQNGLSPYTSPLDGARADRKYSSIRNRVEDGPHNSDKIHIYDHHHNRPVSWPPKLPPGGRLSFRESKTKEADDPYEELPGAGYQTLPPTKDQTRDTANLYNNVNNSNNNEADVEAQDEAEGRVTVDPEPPAPPSSDTRPSVKTFRPTQDPRLSVSLQSGINAEMTNITDSAT